MADHDAAHLTQGRVVCVGLATLDVVQYADRLPEPGTKGASDASWCGAGGPAANAAATIALLGGAVTLVAPLGDDRPGELARADLERAGVELVVPAALREAATTVSSAWVTASGDRTVLSTATAADLDRLNGPALPDDAVAVLLDGSLATAALHAARVAGQRGLPVVLDAGSWKPGLADLLVLTDHAICSARFAFPDTPAQSVDERLARLCEVVGTLAAITDGAAPIVYRRRGPAGLRTGEVRPPRPARVVDTLGAGDVFHGAFVHHLAQRGEDPVTALHAAADVAAASVADHGPRAWAERAG